MSHYMEFRRLTNTPVATAGCYVLEAFNPPQIKADSPALEAMTDLARVPAATIGSDATLEEANQSMILRGVRLLLVVDGARRIAGVVTSVDLLGEKPLLIAQKHQTRRNDLLVSDVMTPVDQMETLTIDDVRRSYVGDIVATMKADGRVHALVVGDGPDGNQRLVGIFSATQIARQFGLHLQTHEMARIFAEIEAVITGL